MRFALPITKEQWSEPTRRRPTTLRENKNILEGHRDGYNSQTEEKSGFVSQH
jgi:hypothetical protein